MKIYIERRGNYVYHKYVPSACVERVYFMVECTSKEEALQVFVKEFNLDPEDVEVLEYLDNLVSATDLDGNSINEWCEECDDYHCAWYLYEE